MNAKHTILINHLMEPPNKITGVTRYLFALLSELLTREKFNYILVTTWHRDELPEKVNRSNLTVVTRRFYNSMPLNVFMQMVTLPFLYRRLRAVLEFNGNSIGCIWPFWPRVITVHDCIFYIIPERYPLRHRLWWKTFFPLGLAAASKAVCLSKNTKGDLHRLFPGFSDKAVVVHEASALMSHNYTVRATRLSQPYAIYVANISPYNNLAVLAAALKILEQSGTSITVYHVGRDELSLLSDAMLAAEVQNPVQSIGTLSDDALAAAYAGAVCSIVTSTHEGFCLPILEAQTVGISCNRVRHTNLARSCRRRGPIF